MYIKLKRLGTKRVETRTTEGQKFKRLRQNCNSSMSTQEQVPKRTETLKECKSKHIKRINSILTPTLTLTSIYAEVSRLSCLFYRLNIFVDKYNYLMCILDS